jgi:cobalt-zinc-cadmium resistance protein CzcA
MANLLSVGALDFGLVVDATVIMVENIFRHMVERSEHGRMTAAISASPAAFPRSCTPAAKEPRHLLCRRDHHHQLPPLFTLTGVEGHIFGPMAKTYAYAIAGGLIATFTVAPVMAMILLPDKLSEVETWIVQRLRRVYEPASRFALANRIVTLGARGCCSWPR